MGLILFVAGVLFFLLFGRWLLPERKARELAATYQLGEYITELRVAENLKDWGEVYDFPLVSTKPQGFTAADNLDEDVEWRDNWINLISLCMSQKNPDEIAVGECGAADGSTQTLELRPASQDDITEGDDDDDDDVLIVNY